jgi:hypothetical protein
MPVARAVEERQSREPQMSAALIVVSTPAWDSKPIVRQEVVAASRHTPGFLPAYANPRAGIILVCRESVQGGDDTRI